MSAFLTRLSNVLSNSIGPPSVTCSSALGMESGHIQDVSIMASSRFDQNRGPERSRFNLTQNGNYKTNSTFLVINLLK